MNKENLKNKPVKIGWELLIPFNIIFLFLIYSGIEDQELLAIIIGILGIIGINYLFWSLKYCTDQHFLYIKQGIFGTQKINVHHIKKIEKTWNPLASPALSIFGRVEITWPVGNFIIIAPKNFEVLRDALLSINENIIVKE